MCLFFIFLRLSIIFEYLEEDAVFTEQGEDPAEIS